MPPGGIDGVGETEGVGETLTEGVGDGAGPKPSVVHWIENQLSKILLSPATDFRMVVVITQAPKTINKPITVSLRIFFPFLKLPGFRPPKNMKTPAMTTKRIATAGTKSTSRKSMTFFMSLKISQVVHKGVLDVPQGTIPAAETFTADKPKIARALMVRI